MIFHFSLGILKRFGSMYLVLKEWFMVEEPVSQLEIPKTREV